MRRRDLLRAAGSFGVLSALPLAACGRGPAPVGSPSSTVRTTARTTAADSIGGVLVQAKMDRRSAPAPESVRNKLMPVAAALYRAAMSGDGNAVLSPYSIVSALGMLALGARNATAQQLAKVLGADAPTVAKWLGGADAAFARAITASAQNAFDGAIVPAVIEPANAVFLRPDSGVTPAYLDALATDYGAGIRQVNFAAAAAATAAINQWVDQRTHGLIPNLVPAGFVDVNTVLVLVNALYLKAAWVNPFDLDTVARPFTTLTGTVSVPFMTRSDKMLYASGSKWQSVSVPLSALLAMTVIVPAAGAFRQVAAGLDARLLSAATSGKERQVELAMPAFSVDVQTDLEGPLRTLGLGQLFDAPDLSGIGRRGLFVSGAVHRARISVDEKGIEAAAATAMAIAASAAPAAPPVRLDRPFLYVVHDVETNTPLFLGRVTDPTS